MDEKRENIVHRFGRFTFNKAVQEEKLSAATFKKLTKTIEGVLPLDPTISNEVAHAMKEWALSHGTTHFTHWFQPIRGVTAEKHDAFLTLKGNGKVIERFSGAQLVKGEPDASSFPSGGSRTTFEARGYTAWDPSSPAFIMAEGNASTLVIPSVFMSYTGEVLDRKTPLLRSLAAVEQKALKVLRALGNRSAKHVRVTVGPEQEYFVIDKTYFEDRPDLLLCERTLMGALPAKHQQMEDHYFGTIKTRVLNFMHDVDMACVDHGIPVKTRHNEVSPAQFEIAPIFEAANVATDHNLQLMDIMVAIAERHELIVLFHEKPFDGVNGSGKHINWSMGDSEGNNLLEPGQSPKKNMQFLIFCSAVLYAVHKYGDLLRMTIADAGNDHRLGANEAPPAIMSVFLGENIERLLDDIEKGDLTARDKIEEIDLGLKALPNIALDNTDRNRTSPIAFTGNKFEIRAAGSSMNISEPVSMMSLAVADGLDFILGRFEKAGINSENVKKVVLETVRELIVETKRVRFGGNNYSEEWLEEAKKRELPIALNTPSALEWMTSDHCVALHDKFNVLTRNELESRKEIHLEAYVKIKTIELKTIMNMTETLVIPALLKQIELVGAAYTSLCDAGITNEDLKKTLDDRSADLSGLSACCREITTAVTKAHSDLMAEAVFLGDEGVALLEKTRLICDRIEVNVDDEVWPLPKYHDMLFRH